MSGAQQTFPRTTNPRLPFYVIKWKGDKSFCGANSYNCLRGQTKNSIVPKWSRPVENMDNTFTTRNDLGIKITRELGPAFKARPIKHWRKQLAPRETTGYSSAGIGMPMDTPSGSIYMNAKPLEKGSCCVKDSFKLATYISKLPQTSTKDTPPLNVGFDINPINPVFNKQMCCNPEKNIIKSATTNLSKSYYTNSIGYLKARGKTYDQNLFGSADDPTKPTLRDVQNATQPCPDGGGGKEPKPLPIKFTYNPSNSQFATQGAVSSSTRLDRLKLNIIQKGARNLRYAWGVQSARAAAYNGKPDAPYLLKSKYNGNINCPSVYHRKGNHTLCFKTIDH